MKRQQQKSIAPATTVVRRAAPVTRKAPATSARNAESQTKPTTSQTETAATRAPAAKAPATRRGTKPATRSAASPSTTKHPPAQHIPDLYSSIHALLHTMRLIEQHEEPLCSMHDELRRTGRLSAAHHRKLQQLVHELPAHDYQADLETLRYALAAQNL